MTKEKIINSCEFQNGCIEYKDISYLKIMPICAIYELSIACHDKENKCKYYQVYKQLKRLQEENKKLKNKNNDLIEVIASGNIDIAILQKENEKLKEKNKSIAKDYVGVFGDYQKYKQALEEIRKEITPVCSYCSNIDGFSTWEDCENVCEKGVIKYLKIIDEALNEQK